MAESMSKTGGPSSFKSRRRKAVVVSHEELIQQEPLREGQSLPLLVQPSAPGINLLEWGKSQREMLQEKLKHHGGILFRGFEIGGVEAFERFVSAVGGDTLQYKERSSPRSQVSGNIYTSTDYPASQEIFLHNENSYQHTWPMRIFFYCVTPAETRGETPIADTRRIYQRLDPAIRERFEAKGWCYVRNFGEGFGLTWQTVFQTEDRREVEAYCAEKGIEVEWKGDGQLRTRAIRRAIANHPETGEKVWFNHATFFHISTLEPSIQEGLLREFDEDELPANAYYGDGTPIEPESLDELRRLYQEESVYFSWQKDDVLMLDNMMVAHGRAPFTGPRKVVVGMAQPCSWEQI